MKINKLPSEIFNRIAAGEVVESPSSIVKELVENSIDAGATEITVTIKGGGIDYLQIIDNGSGIAFEDMPTAFLPHATSKIGKLDDLDNIATLGFRGEALPSIAAVADVTMVSRTTDNDIGGEVAYENGRLIRHEECGAKIGTTVTVINLFDRIPARKKFLAKPSREETKIFTLIEHLVLANPNIVFRFNSESKCFASSGEGLKSAVFAVYGDNVIKNTVSVSLEEGPVKIEGFTCVPSFTKPSKNYQNIIINGRYVESADISYAVYSVYMQYLMKRQYPLFVLHLSMPYDMVDVNVHPSKMQVKFADTVMVKSIVARAVKNAIMPRLTDAKQLTDNDFTSVSSISNTKSFEQSAHSLKSFFDVSPQPIVNIPEPPPYTSDKFIADDNVIRQTSQDYSVVNDTVESDNDGYKHTIDFSESQSSGSSLQSESISNNVVDNGASYADVFESIAQYEPTKMLIPTECKYVGKLFNTYLIMERDDKCYFIDQHAAHEKILYDKLLANYEKRKLQTQPLILPFVFDVGPIDAELINENIEYFAECGFEIAPFGECTFSLSQIPYECAGIDFNSFISDLLLLVNSREKSPLVLKERLMQSACKAAVKGEIDDLSQSEIEALLTEMTARNITMFCPHGRPIAVAFSKKEIEKWFKRIV